MDIAQFVKTHRSEIQMTIPELAEQTKLDEAYLTSIEDGDVVPSVPDLYRVAKALGQFLWKPARELESINKRISALEAERNEVKSELKEVESQIEALEGECSTLEIRLERIDELIDELYEDQADAEEDIGINPIED